MVMNRLEAAGKLPENQDSTKQLAIRQAREILVAAGVKDPGMEVPSPVVSQTAKAESQLVLPSLDKLVVVVPAPEIAKTWEKKGITNFDFFRFSAHQFDRNGNYPGWNIKPEEWFWENVANEKISRDATRLEEVLVAIDRIQKPNYTNGSQLYRNDPFADLLRKLRKEGKIEVPREYRHIPDTSRFGITPDELDEHVLPEIAKMLEVNSNQVRLPKEIEFNAIGNLFHEEWGDTNNWEWMQDKFEDGHRLIGGDSVNGGLSNVYCDSSAHRHVSIGFRSLVVLSPKA